MTTIRLRMNARILLLYLTLVAISVTHSDADRSIRLMKGPNQRRNMINKNPKKLKITKHFDLDPSIYSSNAQAYSINSPLSLPPYGSLSPIPLTERNSDPYCVYPPPTSSTPSITIPTPTTPTDSQPNQPSPPYYYTPPVLPTQSPPPTPTTIAPGPPETLPTPTPEIIPSPPSNTPEIIPSPPSNTPEIVPSPPSNTPEIVPSPPSNTPGSPEPTLNPPIIFPGPPESPSMSPPYYEPAPPYLEPATPSIPSPTGGSIPSPPSSVPSPSGGSVPSPIVFQPPVVYPPPTVPPSPNTAPQATLWCVAKPSVPDPIIEEAMNYACWSGADCTAIQPNGVCYEPNTMFAHASYAFNSYWQRTKASGGNCAFGGTAMLVAVDPSYDGCHFIYN